MEEHMHFREVCRVCGAGVVSCGCVEELTDRDIREVTCHQCRENPPEPSEEESAYLESLRATESDLQDDAQDETRPATLAERMRMLVGVIRDLKAEERATELASEKAWGVAYAKGRASAFALVETLFTAELDREGGDGVP